MENFGTETCNQIATEFAGLFSVQPTRSGSKVLEELGRTREMILKTVGSDLKL